MSEDGARHLHDDAASVPPAPKDEIAAALRATAWWKLIPEIVILTLTGALPLIVLANVIARYTNWFHVLWAEDVVKVAFLWIVFLGGAVAVKYEAHVRMAMLSDRIGRLGKAGAVWDGVIRVSPIAIGAILLVLGVRIVEISMFRELPTLRISAGYFVAIVPISGALMIFYVLQQLARRWSGRRWRPQ
jgi:TRAP-type C4-dicarboxylate transport system permease small subunit